MLCVCCLSSCFHYFLLSYDFQLLGYDVSRCVLFLYIIFGICWPSYILVFTYFYQIMVGLSHHFFQVLFLSPWHSLSGTPFIFILYLLIWTHSSLSLFFFVCFLFFYFSLMSMFIALFPHIFYFTCPSVHYYAHWGLWMYVCKYMYTLSTNSSI